MSRIDPAGCCLLTAKSVTVSGRRSYRTAAVATRDRISLSRSAIMTGGLDDELTGGVAGIYLAAEFCGPVNILASAPLRYTASARGLPFSLLQVYRGAQSAPRLNSWRQNGRRHSSAAGVCR